MKIGYELVTRNDFGIPINETCRPGISVYPPEFLGLSCSVCGSPNCASISDEIRISDTPNSVYSVSKTQDHKIKTYSPQTDRDEVMGPESRFRRLLAM